MSVNKYQWPASAITDAEMQALYQIKQKTKTPINQLIKKAILEMLKEEK